MTEIHKDDEVREAIKLTVFQIEPDNDPRETHNEGPVPPTPSSDHTPPNPLRTHNPWNIPSPDPDDGDISQVEWHGPNGMHFSRISFRSNIPTNRPPPTTGTDIFGDMLSTILNSPAAATRNNASDRRSGPPPRTGMTFEAFPRSPLQEGPPRQAFGTYSGTAWINDPGGNAGPPHPLPIDDFQGILSNLLAIMQHDPHGPSGEAREAGGAPPPQPFGPLSFLQQLFNPANARAGDAVFTQEALDRVISQLMEQHSTSTAPGPASAAAIAALPKVQIGKEHLDSQGKAECSICMDSLELGNEVTQLPCKHWFHGECVGAWLGEHDTCPQCRRGIMPKEGDGSQPRSPGQVPRNMQSTPWPLNRTGSMGSGGAGIGAGANRAMSPEEVRRGLGFPSTPTRESSWRQVPGAYPGSGSRQHPYEVPESPGAGGRAQRPSVSRRQSSSQQSRGSGSGRSGGGGSGNGGGGGGITGWLGRHLGGGSSGR